MVHGSEIRYKVEGLAATSVVSKVLKQRPGWFEVGMDDPNWNLFWCDLQTIKNINECSIKPNQKITHFRNFYELSRKNHLSRNLKKYKKQCIKSGNLEQAELCDALPTTFEIPNEVSMFRQEAKKDPRTTWIAKPSSSSQGRGIFLFKKLSEFEEWMKNKDWSPKERHRSDDPDDIELIAEIWVVQKYITNPYLLDEKKFDIRMYVLVTSFAPLTVWIARDGIARFSGLKYCEGNLSDNYMHLTNSTIQLSKNNLSKGHKWDIQNVRHYMTAMHGREATDRVFQDIGRVVIMALKSVENIMIGNRQCFELFGFDILVQDNLTVNLLEINAAPSLSSTDKHDFKLKFNLIQDVLNVIDLEKNWTGKEIRIGGFDKLWCNGPLYRISKGIGPPEFSKKSHLYNMYLGCLNDREKQLTEMKKWTDLLKK